MKFSEVFSFPPADSVFFFPCSDNTFEEEEEHEVSCLVVIIVKNVEQGDFWGVYFV